MSSIQDIQGQPVIDEKAILQMIDTVLSQLYQFQEQKNHNMKVLILVGVTGSGKSTIFNLLGGAKFKLIESEDGVEELELEEISQEFSVMKGGMQSVTKQPKYYFNEEFNHLLIDFPGFQDTNGEFDQIMIQMLFYKISTQSKVKILYVIRHPELEFQDRGTNLQEFVRATFKEQSIGIENLTLLLNAFNEEYYSDEEVKTSATEQICQLYNTNNSLNIIVLRKINSEDDIVKQFSDENRRKIWEGIIKSEEIKLQPIEILHTEKISAYLSEKSFKCIEKVWLQVQSKLAQNLQKAQQNDLSRLQKLRSMFEDLTKIKKTDYVESFEKFVFSLGIIAQQLCCSQEVKYKREEFLKIYQFFQQFSDLINGYSECQKHSNFARDLQNDMIRMIENKIDFLKEVQKVENTTVEKNQEINLKNKALLRAEYSRKLKKQYQQQLRQLEAETKQLKQEVISQRYEKYELENKTALIQTQYYKFKQQSEQDQRNLDQRIQQERNTQYQIQRIFQQKQEELNDLKKRQQQQLNAIQAALQEQEQKKRGIMNQISSLKKVQKKFEVIIQAQQAKQNIDRRKQTNQKLPQLLIHMTVVVDAN
ncbi:unnamed protein product (macronuclear) [Paramecium tetraurelia]|uniref:G domain-containing protein n=1 Tax=Paramecium tetraurelia TaxID=5888 RepID=A0E3E9_PARTE|nr:uncharacterized protein GSPATT00022989001 [Paramecium tetraurelia]CAK89816.1 unnamed protein product [Paramecium tetraurelia]|eukprot:XP_001457213.1 hypothetical protein (macronuclear) [Paramecium tetraurelia strain d4-2]